MSPHGRLLFVGLWTIADREGRLEDRPKRIKAEIFPYESVQVEPLLKRLHEAGFIVRYEVGGVPYIAIPSFLRHQNPHHREAPSRIPAPGEGRAKPQAEPRAEPNLGTAEPGTSRAVTDNGYGNRLLVAVGMEPEANASAPATPAPERDLAETVISRLPVNHRHDAAARDECYQFARDFPGMFVETAKAIEAARREGKAPFPSNLRPHMPGWRPSNGRANAEQLFDSDPVIAAHRRRNAEQFGEPA